MAALLVVVISTVLQLITWSQGSILPVDDYDYDGTQNCGLPVMPPGSGLRNGGYAESRSAPWQARLCLTNHPRRGMETCFCGGVLVARRAVLTAAHCFNDISSYQINYKLVIKLGDESATYYPSRGGVYRHYSYERRTYDNDIALVMLSQSVTLSSNILPACLPDRNMPFSLGTGLVTGWDRQPRMREVKMNVVRWQECVRIPRHRNHIITTNMFCAKDASPHAGIVKGFSGGPLVAMQGGRWVLQGLVSWGFPHRPITVFTEVGKYRGWLEDWGVGWDS